MNKLIDECKAKSTLSKVSENDNGNAVVDYQNPVYNFDIIAQNIANLYRANRPNRSCDALYIKDDMNIYLIEFKNARRSKVNKKVLHQKAYDSIMTLQMAFFPNLSLEELKSRVVLIIVYNDAEVVEKEQDSVSFNAFKEKMGSLTKNQSRILFDLGIFQGVLYKDVLTVEKQEYVQKVHNTIFDEEN